MKWKDGQKVLERKYDSEDTYGVRRKFVLWPTLIGDTYHWLCYVYIKQHLTKRVTLYLGYYYYYYDGDYTTYTEYAKYNG
jgi:hypothetical protein